MIHLSSQLTFANVQTWLRTSILATAIAATAWPLIGVAAETPAPSVDSAKALSNMFSQDIRDTLNACIESGGVNLAQGAAKDGSVQCKDEKKRTKIPYETYLTTFSDFVSAGFLVGFKAALQDDPQAQKNATAIQELFRSDAGTGLLKQVLTTALTNTQAIAGDSPASLDILVAEVLKRTQPILKDSVALNNLFGSETENKQIVAKFCSTPGMSVQKAQTEIPGITSIQLYASCIQASGLAKEMVPAAKPSEPDKTPGSSTPAPSQPTDPAKP
jgi:hypothetical protein